jgi:hypothetical protein
MHGDASIGKLARSLDVRRFGGRGDFCAARHSRGASGGDVCLSDDITNCSILVVSRAARA